MMIDIGKRYLLTSATFTIFQKTFAPFAKKLFQPSLKILCIVRQRTQYRNHENSFIHQREL